MSYHIGPSLVKLDPEGFKRISKEDFRRLTKDAQHLVLGSVPVRDIGLHDGFLERFSCEFYQDGDTIYIAGQGKRGPFVHIYSLTEEGAKSAIAKLDPHYERMLKQIEISRK